MDGLSGLYQLTTLYLSNNLIKAWNELDKLVSKKINHKKKMKMKMKMKIEMNIEIKNNIEYK